MKINEIDLNSRQLWRACYGVGGKMRTITFSAEDLMAAQSFVEQWERTMGVEILTYKPIGLSKFPEAFYARSRSRL